MIFFFFTLIMQFSSESTVYCCTALSFRLYDVEEFV